MNRHRLWVAAIAAAASVAFAQGTTTLAPPAPGSAPAASGSQAGTPPGGSMRPDPTSPQSRGAPATTTPSAGRGLNESRNTGATPPRSDALGAGTGTLGSNLPAIGGITPNRAELPGSAFTKLDASNKGYVTLDDVRQLDGCRPESRRTAQCIRVQLGVGHLVGQRALGGPRHEAR
jgi:hypothetical protein